MIIGGIIGAIVGFQTVYMTKMANEIKKQSEYISKYSDELFKGDDK